jgi:diguanylate cyclase (GGDEF)-like protein
MKLRFSIQHKLLASHFLAVLLVSGSIGSFFYLRAARSLHENVRVRLQNSAALIAEFLDATELGAIRAEKDVALPEYERHLGRLRALKLTNPDISFLYVMRRTGGRVEFVLDSDDTAEQARPGREYTNVVPAMLAGFARPSVDDDVSADEWGTFLSGYAPLCNGKGQYLVGMDMRVADVQEKFRALRSAGLMSLAGAVVLALLFSRTLSLSFTVPIKLLIARCTAMSQGRPPDRIAFSANDEFNTLIGAFNRMSEHLVEADRQREAALADLRRAKDELETRVVQRTQDLEQINRQMIGEIVQRRKAEEALEKAALTDPLTEIPNRRAMMDILNRQAAQATRSGSPLGIVLADVDLFKAINDSLGHVAGDRVLRDLAGTLRRTVRTQDVVCRWGGEEFLTLLPDTDLASAVKVAEKIRARVERERFEGDYAPAQITISAGVAVFDGRGSPDSVLKAADDALYRAKRAGRNRVAGPAAEGASA